MNKIITKYIKLLAFIMGISVNESWASDKDNSALPNSSSFVNNVTNFESQNYSYSNSDKGVLFSILKEVISNPATTPEALKEKEIELKTLQEIIKVTTVAELILKNPGLPGLLEQFKNLDPLQIKALLNTLEDEQVTQIAKLYYATFPPAINTQQDAVDFLNNNTNVTFNNNDQTTANSSSSTVPNSDD
jgi:hypothetical protein